eukprot:437196_1
MSHGSSNSATGGGVQLAMNSPSAAGYTLTTQDNESEEEKHMTSNATATHQRVRTSSVVPTNQKIEDKCVNATLIGQYITLKNIQDGSEVRYEIQDVTSPPKDLDDHELPALIEESTNQWLFFSDVKCSASKSERTEFWISFIVISLQILAYITLTYYLINDYQTQVKERADNCYGPNCGRKEQICMHISTGSVTIILLVGYLWADFLNAGIMIKNSTVNESGKYGLHDPGKSFGSIAILIELLCALICGVFVGLYSDTEFDAINGAVGILFVHDLDEKIYSAMEVLETNWKRIVALILWIILSIVIAASCACIYTNNFWFSGAETACKAGQFKCSDGECIWEGFVCNGLDDCADKSDEDQNCDFSFDYCPNDMFQCESNGLCIDLEKTCNGILDCDDGSDETRNQNCTAKIANIVCGNGEPSLFVNRDNNTHYKTITDGGYFKCDSGQCIHAKYICDGHADCLDSSDEWPKFYRPNEWPYLKQCPYDQLIECKPDQVLCKISGQCMSLMRVCDMIDDCPNGEDEIGCDYRHSFEIQTCKVDYWQKEWFQCGGTIAMINESYVIWSEYETFGADKILYPNGTDEAFLLNQNGTDFIPINHVFMQLFWDRSESLTECVPITSRCDQMNDCSDGSDEELCSEYRNMFGNQNEMFECAGGGIPKTWQCDGFPDFPCGGMDEYNGINSADCNVNDTTHNIECNAPVYGSITETVAMMRHDVFIPCEYDSVTIKTCVGNDKSPFRRRLIVFRPDDENAMGVFTNVGACNDGSDGSIILDEYLISCSHFVDRTTSMYIMAQYPKEAFGNYSLEVICT